MFSIGDVVMFVGFGFAAGMVVGATMMLGTAKRKSRLFGGK